ncbi:hypothetical protein [Brevibacterium marinum]|uniref:CHRD domain-containing protein n=1 Tax=Brevibacterium marinum TaxID=418643 RepID=A0A846S6C5_9MICO|nr:hypothetical protein [Brevibacterium marinum]NJC56387.1 hypothetical protein [Brevibacterium marinum]
MRTAKKLMLTPVLALTALGLAAGPAAAAPSGGSAEESWTYQADLGEINDSGASGDIMITLKGDQAMVTEHVEGLAETFMDGPYPHVQHIHVKADGSAECPTPSADENGDGIVNTPEGGAAYGEVSTTLTDSGDTSADAAVDVDHAGIKGGSATYERTIDLDDKTKDAIKDGRATVVVHGLDPADQSTDVQDAKSPLDDSLPQAATAPALCGTLADSQMGQPPKGGPDTGGGSTAGTDDTVMLAAGGGVLVAAGAAFAIARRKSSKTSAD